MQYRKLGRTGVEVSAISLGTEYLINQSPEKAATVIHAAIERGINYFDLFWAQPRFRNHMGAAFRGQRERVMLAAHLGATWTSGQGDKSRDLKTCETFFNDFLARYHTDYADVLYLHNIDPQEDYDQVMMGGVLDLAQRLRQAGKARYIGFSGHTASTALQAVESGQVDVLMFPINLAGHAVPGKKELLAACAAHNVGLVAMKPFAGGKLLRRERSVALEDFQVGGAPRQLDKGVAITPVQCLAYVLAQVGVSTSVPGAKSITELDAALGYWQATEEQKDFAAILTHFQQYRSDECVYCNHCLPCPAVIDIGQTIRLFELAQQHMTAELRAAYAALEANAADCQQCGACVERCPFGVDVIAKMEQAAAFWG